LNKYAVLILKGILLGLGIGLCLAGLVGILYKALHGQVVSVKGALAYFFTVGGLMGMLGGWALALQMTLSELLGALFMKMAELVPLPAREVGEDWARKMEMFFLEIVRPFPGFFRKFIEWIFILRFEDYRRINHALDKARKHEPSGNPTTQWMLLVILHYLLQPLWFFFYAAYGILFLFSCILWSLAFFR